MRQAGLRVPSKCGSGYTSHRKRRSSRFGPAAVKKDAPAVLAWKYAGLVNREDPIPLHYCFGFDEADVREEIARTGKSAIPQWIAAMVKQGPCACEARNPSVACCLGEVIKTVTRLTCDDLLNDQAGDGASRAALLKRSKNRSSEKES
jgi:hypothetical protein